MKTNFTRGKEEIQYKNALRTKKLHYSSKGIKLKLSMSKKENFKSYIWF